MDDKTPVQKAFALFAHLFYNNRFYSLTQLASLLNVSKPTVTRLITQLEVSGFGMIRRKCVNKEAWYKFEPRKDLSRLKINVEGLCMLSMCKDFLSRLLPGKMLDEMEGFISQVEEILPKGAFRRIERLGYALGGSGRINYEPHRETLLTLFGAIHSKSLCEIEYASPPAKGIRAQTIKPEKFATLNDAIYIEGLLLKEGGGAARARVPVHRIRKCRLVEKTAPEIEAADMPAAEPLRVKAWFAPEAAMYVSERDWSEKQEIETNADGSIILSLEVGNVSECISWIMGFGDQGMILEPGWLAEEAEKTIARMLLKYKNSHPARVEQAI